jgi:hypothetical protein
MMEYLFNGSFSPGVFLDFAWSGRVVRTVRGNYKINIRAYGKRYFVKKYMEIIPDQADQKNHFLVARFSRPRPAG